MAEVGLRSALAAVAIVISGAPVIAQVPPVSWTAQVSDNGSLITGFAALPDYSLTITCTAPSPQGLSLMQTGSHESHRSGPFELFIGFSDILFDWQPPFRQRGVLMVIGDYPFALPDFELNELQGTAAMLSMSAPLVQRLRSASSLALLTPQGVTHRFSVQGLAAALDTALSPCIDRWAALGYAVPADVHGSAPIRADAVSAQPAPDASKDPRAPTGDAELPVVISDRVHWSCGGQARIEASALRATDDFDADGVPDYVIHYGEVTCQPETTAGFCGAANCLIEVFLSSRGYTQPFEFLAIDVEPAVAGNGRRGLRMSATPFMCSDGACDGVWLWTGETFSNE